MKPQPESFEYRVLDALPDPTVIVDLDYSVLFANAAARLQAGLPEPKRLAVLPPGCCAASAPRCHEISHRRLTPCDGIDHCCPLKAVVDTGKSARTVHRHFGADGHEIWVDVHAAPVFDDEGRVACIVESCRDISASVLLERELARQRERLEELVQERTFHLTEALARLETIATTDLLTGIGNRRRLIETLCREMARARRHRRELSLLMLDLDDFKSINDALGHAHGDCVLRSIAQRIQQGLRATDALARWGGDEFVVVAPETDLLEAERLAGRLRCAIRGAGLGEISIGIAALSFADSPETLLDRADRALLSAKRLGKSRVAVASDPHTAQGLESGLESRLESGLGRESVGEDGRRGLRESRDPGITGSRGSTHG
ncbi:MAG: GGDEF domain-containing protein [Deltaproteobacteria bacterium]|nr:GGDEF domain-containing protein [Deltaproteobacteria bacterium]